MLGGKRSIVLFKELAPKYNMKHLLSITLASTPNLSLYDLKPTPTNPLVFAYAASYKSDTFARLASLL